MKLVYLFEINLYVRMLYSCDHLWNWNRKFNIKIQVIHYIAHINKFREAVGNSIDCYWNITVTVNLQQHEKICSNCTFDFHIDKCIFCDRFQIYFLELIYPQMPVFLCHGRKSSYSSISIGMSHTQHHLIASHRAQAIIIYALCSVSVL